MFEDGTWVLTFGSMHLDVIEGHFKTRGLKVDFSAKKFGNQCSLNISHIYFNF